MANPLVLLVLVMTTLLSSLLSPASGQPRPTSARLQGGSNGGETPIPPVGGIPPGGVVEISTSFLDNDQISRLCFREDPDLCFTDTGDDFPSGFELKSTNPDVALVSRFPNGECDESGAPNAGWCIILIKPGSTILQLRQNNAMLASYILVVTPSFPGTRCQLDADDVDVTGIVDCSGTCMLRGEVRQRLGDGVCDDGKKLDDRSRDIDLSCVFLPEFFLTEVIFEDLIDVIRIDRDGGDCSSEQSCTAQFGDAPGFEFCSGTDNLCSFNATTGGGTCAAMCQRFGSRCVAALDNNPPGCTSLVNSRDTCETPRQTEICVCERRFLDAPPLRGGD